MAKQKQKEEVKSDFVGFFKSNPKALENLKGMKNAQDPNAQPEIADGQYVARIQSGTTYIARGTPRVKFRMVVDRGAYEGTILTKEYVLAQMSDKATMTDEEIFNRCAVDLVRMGADKNCFNGPLELKEEVEAIGKERPLLRIAAKTNAKGYVGIYINGLAEPAPGDDASEEEAETDDESADTEEEEQDSEGSDDTEDTPDTPVEVGDRVRYQPKGGRKGTYNVHASDEDARTCILKDVTGKVIKGVSWDEVEFVTQ